MEALLDLPGPIRIPRPKLMVIGPKSKIVNGTVTNDRKSTTLATSPTSNIACQQQPNDTSDDDEYEGPLDPIEVKNLKQNPLDS